ncbi:MAG TPA: hypothetical protein DEP23_04700 [Ruminococcaceae bacterium]|nr:hypothetical protein [Oscillospiraceae bacterium]
MPVQKVQLPILHDVTIYSQSPYATVAVDGKKLDGLRRVSFKANVGEPCTVTLEFLTHNVTIRGKATIQTSRNAEKNSQLKRGDKIYQVVCADNETFVVGEVHGASVDYKHLEAYSNSSSASTLEELRFEHI